MILKASNYVQCGELHVYHETVIIDLTGQFSFPKPQVVTFTKILVHDKNTVPR